MRTSRDRWLAFLMISPSIIALLIFVYGFIAWTLRVSLTKWKGLLPDYTWAGLSNYLALLQDRRFGIGVTNTIIFTVLFMGGCLLLGLLEIVVVVGADRGVEFTPPLVFGGRTGNGCGQGHQQNG